MNYCFLEFKSVLRLGHYDYKIIINFFSDFQNKLTYVLFFFLVSLLKIHLKRPSNSTENLLFEIIQKTFFFFTKIKHSHSPSFITRKIEKHKTNINCLPINSPIGSFQAFQSFDRRVILFLSWYLLVFFSTSYID